MRIIKYSAFTTPVSFFLSFFLLGIMALITKPIVVIWVLLIIRTQMAICGEDTTDRDDDPLTLLLRLGRVFVPSSYWVHIRIKVNLRPVAISSLDILNAFYPNIYQSIAMGFLFPLRWPYCLITFE